MIMEYKQFSKKGYFINENNCKNEEKIHQKLLISFGGQKLIQVNLDLVFHNNITALSYMHGYLQMKCKIVCKDFFMLNNKNIIKFMMNFIFLNLKNILN